MKKLPFLFLLVVLGGFFFGLAHLFKLRFEAGDVYPEYSSLRADPLGAKALYESLDNLLTVRRNYRRVSKLGEGRDTTLFYLGSRAAFMMDSRSDLRLLPEEFKTLESFVAGGGRLVISFFPSFQKPSTNRFGPKPPTGPVSAGKNAPTISPKKGPVSEEDEWADFRTVSIRERWGLDYEHDELVKDDNNVYRPAPAIRMAAAEGLPGVILSHTALCFDKLTNSWQVIYARKRTRQARLGNDCFVCRLLPLQQRSALEGTLSGTARLDGRPQPPRAL